MNHYQAPLRDIRFAMNEVLQYPNHYADIPAGEDAGVETVDAVLEEFARFCETEIAPLNQTADAEGCRWQDGDVVTPSGFVDAYRQFADGGWPGLAADTEYGGQGLPSSLQRVLMEMMASASIGFTLYTSAQAGAIETLAAHGTVEQRELYERKLVSGAWNASMCLTEPHCGSDLGLMRCKAEYAEGDCFRISGTKIFITGGEHDLTDNIVHLVLARLPDAPAGNGGISLFIVPKYLPDASGEAGLRNSLSCGGVEQKMGIKASATCVMHFDDAHGFLLGQKNRGLQAMFTLVNASRIAAAGQGVSHAELGFQKSLAYAQDRLQMRSLSGIKNPAAEADPIIVHPDVRRMLLTQKAFAEGNRLLVYYLGMQLDLAQGAIAASNRDAAQQRLELLTPIAKAFCTETGIESANLALQCLGGHGYIREWGVEQNLRDARIATLYEGTTGIQALDLLGRKVVGSGAKILDPFIEEIEGFCGSRSATGPEAVMILQLRSLLDEWRSLSANIIVQARAKPDQIGAASVNYLMFSGYLCLAWLWARSSISALDSIAAGNGDQEFYRAKRITAQFYFDQILPRTRTCVAAIEAGPDSTMALEPAHFRF